MKFGAMAVCSFTSAAKRGGSEAGGRSTAASSSWISPSPPSMEERAGERRCVFIGSPLLGPLPTRSSRGEDGELDAALGPGNSEGLAEPFLPDYAIAGGP